MRLQKPDLRGPFSGPANSWRIYVATCFGCLLDGQTRYAPGNICLGPDSYRTEEDDAP